MRVTGGRWRRIVLGYVLAEHLLELRGMSSRTPRAIELYPVTPMPHAIP